MAYKHCRLVDDSLAYWKPVQANKNQDDLVMAMSPGDQVGCHVLHRLESLKINISNPAQPEQSWKVTGFKKWITERVYLGHGLMGVLMHPPHYLHSLVFSFTPGSVDLEKAC